MVSTMEALFNLAEVLSVPGGVAVVLITVLFQARQRKETREDAKVTASSAAANEWFNELWKRVDELELRNDRVNEELATARREREAMRTLHQSFLIEHGLVALWASWRAGREPPDEMRSSQLSRQ